MVDLKYNILNLIYSTSSRKESLENIINSNFDTPVATKKAIDELVAKNIIKKSINSHSYELTEYGINVFESAKERQKEDRITYKNRANREAEEKERYRKNYILSVISLIVAFCALLVAFADLICSFFT